MLATDVISAARTWRPAEYGDRRAGDIDDAIIEPLWTGPRVLVLIRDDAASITDEAGEPVAGREDVEAELVEAAGGATLLLEGVLTHEPLQAAADVAGRDSVALPKPADMASQMLLGDRLQRRGQLDARLEDVRRRVADEGGIDVAFVAVDLLWIDDQSVMDVPLLERKRVLESVLRESRLVRVGVYIRPPIDPWLNSWRMVGFHRMSFRAANSRYVPGAKNREWAQAEIPRR